MCFFLSTWYHIHEYCVGRYMNKIFKIVLFILRAYPHDLSQGLPCESQTIISVPGVNGVETG